MEQSIAIAIITEPICIPEQNWAGSSDKKAAIYWKPELLRARCQIASKGQGFVAIKYDDIVLFSCYISPNMGLTKYEEILKEMDHEINKFKTYYQLVGGDLNSKSSAWGSKYTCPRGERLEEWAMINDLILINQGNTPTCSRSQGESFIDTTWASANLSRYIQVWRVQNNVEAYSDHFYIEFNIGNKVLNSEIRAKQIANKSKFPRWIYKNADTDTELLEEIIETKCMHFKDITDITQLNVDDASQWVRDTMTEASDAVMKRAKSPQKRKQIHRWNNEIKKARTLH